MVFTVRVRRADQPVSRRSLLAAAVGASATLALGSCGLAASTTVVWHPPPDPLLPFLAHTNTLAETYDAAITTLPALESLLAPLRDAHRQHVLALQRELGLVGSPIPTAPPSPAPTTGGAGSVGVPSRSGGTGTSGSPRGSATPSGSTPSGSPSVLVSPTAASPGAGAATLGGTRAALELPTDRAGIIAALRAAETAGQTEALSACLGAPSYRAALLGSIAAARASHLVVLL